MAPRASSATKPNRPLEATHKQVVYTLCSVILVHVYVATHIWATMLSGPVYNEQSGDV